MRLAAVLHRVERGQERRPVRLPGTVRDRERAAFDVTIEDLSPTGFRIRRGHVLAIDEEITLGVAGLGVRAAVVVRATGTGYGCEFRRMLDPGEFEAAMSGGLTNPIRFSAAAGERIAPSVEPFLYSRRVRLLGTLALTAACWGVIAAAAVTIL